MDAHWRIELLGRLRARHGEQVLTHFRSRKAAALLAYLAYFRRAHSREELIARFWPERPPGAARTQLRTALTGLRQQLPTGVPPGSLLMADRTTVQLDPAACSTDVGEFEAALRAAARVSSAAERAEWLIQAVEGYPGALLPGGDA